MIFIINVVDVRSPGAQEVILKHMIKKSSRSESSGSD